MEGLELVPLVIQQIAPAILTKMAEQLSEKVTEVKAKLSGAFSQHVKLTEAKCSKVRTIFSGQSYIPLDDIYVNLYLKSDIDMIRDEDVILNESEVGDIVISGTGGAGKTMLMKFIAKSYITKPKGKIPLFIELRTLNYSDSHDFYEVIFHSITREKDFDKYDVFLSGLRQGLFVLILDGLDEVPSSVREAIFQSIQRINLDFPEVRVISSSRPEIETRHWTNLRTYELQPLELDQARMLISKVDFPPALKHEFLGLLTQEFFEQHKTFLSIPLLCSLMLLTYHEYKDVPSRITVFYDQAFETLFRRHDLQKEGYFSRIMESGLSSDRFRTLFSAFCYRTLVKNKIAFSDSSIREHLSYAAADTEIEVDIDKYFIDLVSSVCVIIRDGMDLHFMHRSFQEYFAAVYITRYRGPNAYEVINMISSDTIPNRSIAMAFDIDKKTIEREWSLKAISEITDYLKKFPKQRRALRFVKKTCADIAVGGNPPFRLRCKSWYVGMRFRRLLLDLISIYPDKIQDHFLLSGKV